jgi:hypothetical protein
MDDNQPMRGVAFDGQQEQEFRTEGIKAPAEATTHTLPTPPPDRGTESHMITISQNGR